MLWYLICTATAPDMKKGRRLAYFYIAFIGIQNVVSDFEDSFQSKNSTAIKVTPVLPPERISLAIATGVFEGEDAGLGREDNKATC